MSGGADAGGPPTQRMTFEGRGRPPAANAIYELECAGHRIEREYAQITGGRRSLLGYRLLGAISQVSASQPSSSR